MAGLAALVVVAAATGCGDRAGGEVALELTVNVVALPACDDEGAASATGPCAPVPLERGRVVASSTDGGSERSASGEPASGGAGSVDPTSGDAGSGDAVVADIDRGVAALSLPEGTWTVSTEADPEEGELGCEPVTVTARPGAGTMSVHVSCRPG